MSTDLRRTAPQWTFGDRIRKVRRELRMSQAEFARLIGRGEKAVAAWEAGGKPEDVVGVAESIEDATGYAAAWVLGVERSPVPTEPGAAGNQPFTRTTRGLITRSQPTFDRRSIAA